MTALLVLHPFGIEHAAGDILCPRTTLEGLVGCIRGAMPQKDSGGFQVPTIDPGNLGNEADAARNVVTLFQPAVEELMSFYTVTNRELSVLQFHGKAPSTCFGVNVYMTHGMNSLPSSGDKLTSLKNNLLSFNPTWRVNVPGDSPTCGRNGADNVQGWLLDNVAPQDVCTRSASSPPSLSGVGFSRCPRFSRVVLRLGFLVRRARAGGHPGAEPRIVREYWIPACAGMTTWLSFGKKPTLESSPQRALLPYRTGPRCISYRDKLDRGNQRDLAIAAMNLPGGRRWI